MCIFSRPVLHVASTRILAANLPDGLQSLVYSMVFEAGEDLAMVLPIPVRPESPEDAVTFVSLEEYHDFFEELDKAFPMPAGPQPLAMGRSAAPKPRSKLKVHSVGAFDASFVPTPADFQRLDPRFRIPDVVFTEMSEYVDYGFVVFKLKAGKKQQVHPMAFTFPSRHPDALFFPTVHVHDGELPHKAHFDHTLYAQPLGLVAETIKWDASEGALGNHVEHGEAEQVVDFWAGGFRRTLMGHLDNRDVILAPPVGITGEDLVSRGERFVLELDASRAYWFTAPRPEQKEWSETARRRMGTVRDALMENLPTLLAERADQWKLVAAGEWDDSLPIHFMNGKQVWTGTDYRNGAWLNSSSSELKGRAGRLRFQLWNEQVEPQTVVLSFSALPSDGLAVQIRDELARLLPGPADLLG